jgi:hypothetical protein
VYRAATAFETLLGYLHLADQPRLEEVFEFVWQSESESESAAESAAESAGGGDVAESAAEDGGLVSERAETPWDANVAWVSKEGYTALVTSHSLIERTGHGVRAWRWPRSAASILLEIAVRVSTNLPVWDRTPACGFVCPFYSISSMMYASIIRSPPTQDSYWLITRHNTSAKPWITNIAV